MKKKMVLSGAILLAITPFISFENQNFIYLIAALMAFVVMGVAECNKSLVLKVTRWAKANPRKTRVLITVLQLALAFIGILAGYNFKKLGYNFSNTTVFVLGAIVLVCFLLVPFLPKRSTIALPREVNRQRLLFMGISLSSLVLMMVCGNRIEERYPNSLITQTVKAIDAGVFLNNSEGDQYSIEGNLEHHYNQNDGPSLDDQSSNVVVFASFSVPSKETTSEKKLSRTEKKQLKKLEKFRLAYAAGLSFGAVLLIILLAFLTCAGICLAIGGAIAIGSGEFLGILALLGGGFIAWQAIKGIGNVSKRDRQKN